MLNELRISYLTAFIKSVSMTKHHWAPKEQILCLVLVNCVYIKYITADNLKGMKAVVQHKGQCLENSTSSERGIRHQFVVRTWCNVVAKLPQGWKQESIWT